MSDPESSGASIESASIDSASIESAPIESSCADSGYADSSCADSSCGESGLGRYRVRAVDGAEYSAPDQVAGPRFERRDEAERYADAQGRISERSMIVEKLAAAGCWLPLGTVG
ncbi:MAG: hypothetical protein NT053_16235 [Cyanobacteria bacterium]|nr:hypothetical protein [Cyanobacteriota bacterium]